MDTLLRIEDVAKMTGVAIPTLWLWRMKGEGPPSAKLGRRVVYREREVIAWIDAQFDASAPRYAAS